MFRGILKKLVSSVFLLITSGGDNIVTSGGDMIMASSSHSSDVTGRITAENVISGNLIPEVVRGSLRE